MKFIDRIPVARAFAKGIFVFALLCALGAGPCYAQSYAAALGSYGSLGGLERFIGPLIPACGIGNTFRSEIGAGGSAGEVIGAKLIGSAGGELSLNKAVIDEAPMRFDAYATLRLWRFGFRAAYNNFTTRAEHVNLAKIDFSGLTLGGDVDVIQFPWLSLGASVDFYLYDPTFQGPVFNPAPNNASVTLEVTGRKPSTVGGYLRYIPPEILGFPLHVEAWFKAPMGGSKLASYGGALVFRPQIYRFDVAAKLGAEKTYLKFSNDPTSQFAVTLPGVAGQLALPGQRWEIDMEWNLYGVEVSIYF
jgi:hypothetical protein